MSHTIEEFAALVQAQGREELARRGYASQVESFITQIKPGKKYTKVDVGPAHNMSGRYMIDNATGEIFGIKAYGQIHKGHRYGTLDTIDQWDWNGYTGRQKQHTGHDSP